MPDSSAASHARPSLDYSHVLTYQKRVPRVDGTEPGSSNQRVQSTSYVGYCMEYHGQRALLTRRDVRCIPGGFVSCLCWVTFVATIVDTKEVIHEVRKRARSTRPLSQIWRELPGEREMVITSNGRPVAILATVSESNLEESLAAFRQARAIEAGEFDAASCVGARS